MIDFWPDLIFGRNRILKDVYSKNQSLLYLTISSTTRQCIVFTLISLFIILSLSTQTHARTPGPVILTDDEDKYPLGLHLEILKDSTRQLTIKEITSPEFDNKFVPNKTKLLNPGFVNSAYWIRFTVDNNAHQAGKWWLEISGFEIDVSLYYPRSDGRPGFEEKQAGRTVKGNETYHFFPAFHLPLAPGSTQKIYLHVSGHRLNLPLTLWSETGFVRESQKDFIVQGFYFGVLLIMAIYNLFLFLALRDKSYLYYVLFLICSLLAVVLRIAHTNLILNLVLIAVSTLMVVFLLRFSCSFLMVTSYAPRLNRILNGLQIGVGATGLLYIISNEALIFIRIWFMLVLFGLPLIFITSLITWQRGYRPARYFILAQTILLGAFFLSLLGMAGYALPIFSEIAGPTGVSLMVVLMSFALAERINTIKELTKAKESAESANLAKSIFLANMSHELRTPLNVIMGFSQLMKKKDLLPDMQQEYLSIVYRNGENLLALINDVLEISKIEVGQVAIENTTFYLRAMFLDLEQAFDSSMDAKGLQFEIIGINDLPRYVSADENKLRKVLVNIVGNAVKFTEQGGIIIRLAVKEGSGHMDEERNRANNNGMRLIVEVQDTGVGIAEDEIDKVFSYFDQTASGEAKKSGTGLGLALSRDYVRLMGGDITVVSKEGKGSTFRFEIDIKKGDETDLKAQVPTQSVTGLQAGQKIPRLLVAEDNIDNRILLVKMLKMVGFEVEEAVNGKEAVEMFNRWQPDFIWMDIRMPVMDGITATQQIRNTEAGKTAIVVALTAHELAEEKERLFAVGGNDFVCKPFREQEIFDVMAKHLGLQYVYEDEVENTAACESELEIHEEQLMSLPVDLHGKLHNAAIELDVDRILTLIETIKPIDGQLAKAIETCANKFALGPLLDLLKKVKKPKKEGSP